MEGRPGDSLSIGFLGFPWRILAFFFVFLATFFFCEGGTSFFCIAIGTFFILFHFPECGLRVTHLERRGTIFRGSGTPFFSRCGTSSFPPRKLRGFLSPLVEITLFPLFPEAVTTPSART